ncbi:hypothetical protein SVIO_007250 [Streptomyces violaceusniger]|uniref:FAD-binding PCMH-type domain-containing protein n=1 Tax=Streptomyces violaceusniger TaxID=68280 RepID=A0A4D4KN66_STRVO|nr:hypothetical protein SVIO_007250 [Streptomyces violaceusniger]
MTPSTPTAPAPPAPEGDARLAGLLAACVSDPSRVTTEVPRRAAVAHDASPYLFTPRAVVRAASAAEVGALMAGAEAAGLPLILRSGGTSLAGQASGDGILVDVHSHWRGAEVLDEGRRIRLQPGLTVRQVNACLARYGRRLGPDPASESACTIGGLVANNSSGMNCGTRDNAYRTMESLRFVLPSGTVIDTAAPDADEALRAREPELHAGLLRLRDRIRASAVSRAVIERLFSMKNTLGYGLNSFLDHSDPADILAHLMIGSEGTLAFVGEAVFRCATSRASRRSIPRSTPASSAAIASPSAPPRMPPRRLVSASPSSGRSHWPLPPATRNAAAPWRPTTPTRPSTAARPTASASPPARSPSTPARS